MILEGKTLLVTGVGTGLGSEIVRVAVRDGANVVIGARTEAQLEATAKELDPSGERIAWQRTDITDDDSCAAVAQLAIERFGQLDGVVQVAALDALFGGLMDSDLDTWAGTWDVNVVGTARLVRACVPHLKKAGGGSVVLIGSQSYQLPLVPQVAYASSKGALITTARYLAKELGPEKIRVNTVIPTWMWGPPVELYVKGTAKAQGVSEDEIIAGITANMPLGEIPKDDDVAEAVAFFCSDRARMITGESLLVNAGEFLP